MRACPSCGAPIHVSTSEGDRLDWRTERCTAGCGYSWTFADGGTLDLGLVDAIEPLPAMPFFLEGFSEMPEDWKPCIEIRCEPMS